MANVTTVARPYAKAILMLAKSADAFATWTNMLNCLAAIVQDPNGYKVISNLAVSPKEKAQFICDVAKGVLNTHGENLVKLLARAKRLLILPELFNLYEQMREQAQNMTFIDLRLAQNVDQDELNTIQAICNNNFGGQVILSEEIDNTLISGGVAQIGNRVIDASIMGRLHSMHNLLRK